MTDDVLVMLGRKLPSLRPAEQRVARAVLDQPHLAINSTITELADACSTSPATVVRLCVALGFTGHREFRIAVARAATREQAEQDRFAIRGTELDPQDTVEDIVSKIAFQEARSIEDTARGLDLATVARAAAAVGSATRIDLYGQGPSGLAGMAFQQKLLRINVRSSCWTDPQLALTSAAQLAPGDVAIAISHSGATPEVDRAMTIAHQAGATTIAVTNFPDSPIAAHADLVLTTAVREMRWWSGAMSSRIAQLAVVDFLFVVVAQQRADHAEKSIARSFDMERRYRLPYEGRQRPAPAAGAVGPSE